MSNLINNTKTTGMEQHFSVIIAASGCCNPNGDLNCLVHAVSVTQSIHSWTVLREYQDFVNIGNILLRDEKVQIPPCPPIRNQITRTDDVNNIAIARNSLQEWLTIILLIPNVCESQTIRHFLCQDINIVPPQFEGLAWVSFSQIPTPQHPPQRHHQQQPQSVQHTQRHGQSSKGRPSSSLDEMEMDEMFGYDENEEDHDDHDEDDDGIDYSASARYQPTEEAVTQEDAMEIQQAGEECEMIEDVGSFAQSLGASHLGRSLQLQAQHMNIKKQQHQSNPTTGQPKGPMSGGIQLGKKEASVGGGIGGAVESSNVKGLGDSFHQNPTVSAPRLDSFKMIKVIGKGSFGKSYWNTKVFLRYHARPRTVLSTITCFQIKLLLYEIRTCFTNLYSC